MVHTKRIQGLKHKSFDGIPTGVKFIFDSNECVEWRHGGAACGVWKGGGGEEEEERGCGFHGLHFM